MKAWNYITIDFHQEMGQEYSTIVQIIVKADRGKAIAWHSLSCKMTCYHIPDEKSLQILSLHFVPTMQSVVYILYPVCSLLSALCTIVVKQDNGNVTGTYSKNVDKKLGRERRRVVLKSDLAVVATRILTSAF